MYYGIIIDIIKVMICKCINNGFLYNYSFVDDGMVYLENPNLKDYPQSLKVKYEDWCMDYLIIDKWRSL